MLRKVIDQLNNRLAFRSVLLRLKRVNSNFQPKIKIAVEIKIHIDRSALTITAIAVIAINVE